MTTADRVPGWGDDREAGDDGQRRETVTIVGAGAMGHGIAYVFAAAGHEVRLHDYDTAALASARTRILYAAAALGCDPSVVDNVSFEPTLEAAAAGASFVIEATPEWLATKQELFQRLEDMVDEGGILATCTSGFPIGRVSARLRNPERVVGTHFWSPPHLVPLVEVVPAPSTSAGVIRRTMELLAGIGCKPVHVRRDLPGFIGNRLQHALEREAIALVASGVCDAETLDDVVKFGFGPRLSVLGPLELSDLLGLDLTLATHRTLMPDLSQLAEPHPLLTRLVTDGKTGVDVGEGFRKWTPEEAEAVKRRLEEFLAERHDVMWPGQSHASELRPEPGNT